VSDPWFTFEGKLLMNLNYEGLGLPGASLLQAPSVFQTLVSQGQTNSPVFAFKMVESGGELSIGGLDSSAYSGTPTYANVASSDKWMITFDSIVVGGSVAASNISAIIDSVRLLQFFSSLAKLS
jgi:cathepsin D